MAKRCSKQWKENVSKGVKEATKNYSEETRKKLSEAAKKANRKRDYKRKPISELKSWTTIKDRIFEQRGRRCEGCGWQQVNLFSGICPVQIHHLDGNRKNNYEDNLKVLCPNCHSLTENFMFYGRSHKTNGSVAETD